MPRQRLSDEERLKRRRAKDKRYRENHPDRVAAVQKSYKQRHRERVSEIQANYLSRLSPERKKEMAASASKSGIDKLTDSYVKRLLTHRSDLKWEDIPPELVEIKRASILLKRLLKEER